MGRTPWMLIHLVFFVGRVVCDDYLCFEEVGVRECFWNAGFGFETWVATVIVQISSAVG